MALMYWRFDAADSSIRFSVRHLVVARTEGRFGRFGGALAFDEAQPETAAVEVFIEAASIDTRDRARDAELRDFLEAARFPELMFHATRVEPRGRGRYRLAGQLTIRDVAREVVLEVEDRGRPRGAGGAVEAEFTARTTLDRRDFGLRWNRALEAGGVLVGDKIEVEIRVRARLAADRASAGFRGR